MNQFEIRSTSTQHGLHRARMAGAGLLILFAGLGAGAAQAHDDRRHGGHAYGRGYAEGYRDGRHHQRHSRYRAPEYYAPPPVAVYPQPPPVIVERVIEQPVVYRAPEPYIPPPSYGYEDNYAFGGYANGGNRVLSAAMMGAAGGYLGSQVGHGSGRAAATAAGAVAGWLLGSNLGR